MSLLTALFIMTAPADPPQGTPPPVDRPTGTRVERPVDSQAMPANDQRRVLGKAMKCIYAWEPRRLEAFLDASDSVSVDYEKLGLPTRNWMNVFHVETCFERAVELEEANTYYLQYQDWHFRAMVLPYVYLGRHPSPPAWLTAWPGDPERRYVSTERRLAGAMVAASFSDCVVKAAPALADQFLRTEAASVEERAAIRALVPYLSPCIAEGQTVELKPANLREFIADGLWTMSRAVETGRIAGAQN